MDLPLAIDRARPGAAYLLAGGAIQEWRDERPRPEPAELDTAWAAHVAEQDRAERDRLAAEQADQQAWETLLAAYDASSTLNSQKSAIRALAVFLHERLSQH